MLKKQMITGLLFLSVAAYAQTISGTLTNLVNQELKLEGFKGLETYTIATTKTDAKGNFSLKYAPADYGMGYIISSDNTSFFIVLGNEDTTLQGESLALIGGLKIIKGKENQWFEQYTSEYSRREQALSAWDYLEKLYQSDTLFTKNLESLINIRNEKNRIKKEDADFLANLPKDSYVNWFLPIRRLVSSVGIVAQYRPKEIPATLEALRAIDYTDSRLYKSGLYREAIERHVWFIENSSGELDKVFADLNQSSDILLSQLKTDKTKFNETIGYLLDFLEKRSLFSSADHLATKTLNEYKSLVDDNLVKHLEIYGKLKIGNPAPEINFGEYTYYPEKENAKRLSEIEADYTLVYFAAGWCPHCQEEMPKLLKSYNEEWKSKGVKVVLVSLDETPESFVEFTANLPFISTTDLQKWSGKAVENYAVNGTPTLYILDKDKRILFRPNNIEHAKAWLNEVFKND